MTDQRFLGHTPLRAQAFPAIFLIGIAFAGPPTKDHDATSSLLARRIPPVADLASMRSQDASVGVITGQKKAMALKDAGLPVSALAEAMGVERKTVYAWLDGVEPRGTNASRLAAIHDALVGGAIVNLRDAYRYWSTPLGGGASIRDLLAAPTIDTASVRDAVSSLLSRTDELSTRRARLSISGNVNGLTEGFLEIGESA